MLTSNSAGPLFTLPIGPIGPPRSARLDSRSIGSSALMIGHMSECRRSTKRLSGVERSLLTVDWLHATVPTVGCRPLNGSAHR